MKSVHNQKKKNSGDNKGGGIHHDHHKMMMKDFKRRFWVSVVLSIPVLVLSPMIQSFLGFELLFNGNQYVLFALSSLTFFYGGWPFLKGLKDELSDKSPGMMTLIAVAISVAYFYSGAVVFGLSGKLFFWELVTLIDVMLIGHWVEMKSVIGASKALELLVSMMPSEAHRIVEDQVEDVELEELQKGDILLIKSGEKVPADGIIIEGESYLNESMLTGESKPVKKSVDDEVVGGSINGDNSLKIRIKNTGDDSYLNKVISMVRESSEAKSKTQNFADRAAKWLTYIALTVGIITFATWYSLGFDLAFSLERMVTVMVISCPHALGLAIPLVVAISTSISAQNGLLIRNRTAFENAGKISSLVFDKTGTLTKGNFGVSRYESVNDECSSKEMLQLASGLERDSEHPIAKGVIEKAKDLKLEIPSVKNFKSITGKGVEAEVEEKPVKVVSPGYLKEHSIEIPDDDKQSDADTIVYVLIEEKLIGFIALSDEIREESYEAVKALQKNNIKVLMATGDNERVAKAVSEELGLDGYYSEVLPDEKVSVIKELQEKGEYVAMTGDGVNDAPALAKADIGIAVGSGTDVAAETADIILVESDPMDILQLIIFGKATYNKMIQNLIWATAYNVLAIPLAAGLLYSFDIILSPAVGAVLMSLSTVVVAINAQLLKKEMKK